MRSAAKQLDTVLFDTEGRVAKPERRWGCRHGTLRWPMDTKPVYRTVSKILSLKYVGVTTFTI